VNDNMEEGVTIYTAIKCLKTITFLMVIWKRKHLKCSNLPKMNLTYHKPS